MVMRLKIIDILQQQDPLLAKLLLLDADGLEREYDKLLIKSSLQYDKTGSHSLSRLQMVLTNVPFAHRILIITFAEKLSREVKISPLQVSEICRTFINSFYDKHILIQNFQFPNNMIAIYQNKRVVIGKNRRST